MRTCPTCPDQAGLHTGGGARPAPAAGQAVLVEMSDWPLPQLGLAS